MKNQELFKEAIADAQAVRNAALANAKKSLEEAFAPKVESMLTKKLAEMESQDESAGAEQNEATENESVAPKANESQKGSMEEELDSLLKELGMDESDEANEGVDEGTDIDDASDAGQDLTHNGNQGGHQKVNHAFNEEAPEEDGAGAPEAGLEGGDDLGAAGAEMGAEEQPQEVVDMTVDQLTDVIRQTIQSVMGGGEQQPGDEFGGEQGGEFAGDVAGGNALAGGEEQSPEDVNLEELLAELENEGVENESVENEGVENEGKEVDEAAKAWQNAKPKGGHVGPPKNGGAKGFIKMKNPGVGAVSESETNESETNEARSWQDAKSKGGHVGAPKNGGAKGFIKMKNPGVGAVSEAEKAANEAKKVEETKELKEAIKVIKALKSTLNETNLLNAKLLYVNKIFKAKSLTESQKVKVVSAFDRANTVKEAKVIYESLNEAFSTKKKVAIRESYGSSSKPVGGAPKRQIIVESGSVLRMQQIAGIKPLYE